MSDIPKSLVDDIIGPASAAEIADKPDIYQVMKWLKEQKIPFQKKTEFHIKIGLINYYLPSGKIHIDGDTNRSSRSGFGALKKILSRIAE